MLFTHILRQGLAAAGNCGHVHRTQKGAERCARKFNGGETEVAFIAVVHDRADYERRFGKKS